MCVSINTALKNIITLPISLMLTLKNGSIINYLLLFFNLNISSLYVPSFTAYFLLLSLIYGALIHV